MVCSTVYHRCVNCNCVFSDIQSYIEHKKQYDQHICLICNVRIEGMQNYVSHVEKDRHMQSEAKQEAGDSLGTLMAISPSQQVESVIPTSQSQEKVCSKVAVESAIPTAQSHEQVCSNVAVESVIPAAQTHEVCSNVAVESAIPTGQSHEKVYSNVAQPQIEKAVSTEHNSFKKEDSSLGKSKSDTVKTNEPESKDVKGADLHCPGADPLDERSVKDSEQFGDVGNVHREKCHGDEQLENKEEEEDMAVDRCDLFNSDEKKEGNEDCGELCHCCICDVSFKGKTVFLRHIKSEEHVKASVELSSARLLEVDVQHILLNLVSHQCHMCQFYCTRLDDMQRHIATSEHIANVAQATGLLICEPCAFHIEDNEQITAHLSDKRHKKNRKKQSQAPFIIKELTAGIVCPYCQRIATSVSKFLLHLYQEHKNQIVKECPLCGKKFKFPTGVMGSTFKKHIDVYHAGNKNKITCSICKELVLISELMDHSKTSVNHQKALEDLTGGIHILYYGFKKVGKERKQLWHHCAHCDYKSMTFGNLSEHYSKMHAVDYHICQVCLIRFDSTEKLERHLESEFHQERIWQARQNPCCQFCGRFCKTFEKLRIHEMLVHIHNLSEASALRKDIFLGIDKKYHDFVNDVKDKKGKERLICPECGESIKKLHVFQHLRKHSGTKPFKCMMCHKCFLDSITLYHHLLHEHMSHEFICEQCGKTFPVRSHLQQHVSLHHLNLPDEFLCEICSATFKIEKQLRCHMKIHQEKNLDCPRKGCSYKTYSYLELKTHMVSHSTDRPYSCDLCDFTGKTKRSVGYHHQRMHALNNRTFPCRHCSYAAKSKKHLENHLRVHTGSKPYKCPYCDYTSAVISNIHKHISETTNGRKTGRHPEMPQYPCTLCESVKVGFDTLTDFREHLAKVHSIAQKELYGKNTSIYCGIYQPDVDTIEVATGSVPKPIKPGRKPRNATDRKFQAKKMQTWEVGKMTQDERQVAETITKLAKQKLPDQCMGTEAPDSQRYIRQTLVTVSGDDSIVWTGTEKQEIQTENVVQVEYPDTDERVVLEFNNEEEAVIYITSLPDGQQQVRYV